MRRAVAIAIAATALSLVGAATPAGALARNPSVRLTIATLPKLAGARFALDGRTFVTGRSGYARIKTTPGTHLLQALDTSVRRPTTRSTFVRWSDGRFTGTRTITIAGNTLLYAGYRQSVLVHFRFTDPAGRPVVGRVARLTLSNSLGGQLSFRPEWPRWLPAISLTRRFSGLGQTLVRYSIKQALVGGSNVVNQAQQRFYPALTRQVTARLLLYSARVSVRDFLLGTAAGSRLNLVYPNGTRATYSLHGKELRLSSLPRGTYQVEVRGGGYVPTVSLALSRNQVLRIKVVSYLDMFLFLVMAFAAVAALALVARPYLRLRIRAFGSGKRPTPDDLEPIKPLSGARKELIVRYMVPAPSLPQTARGVQRLAARSAPGIAGGRAENRAARRLGMLPQLALAAAADRLRRLQDSLRRMPRPRRLPAVRRQPPREALSGERIELVHVYMGETSAPPRKVAAPAAQAQPVEAAPTAVPEIGERRWGVLIARQRAALAGFQKRFRNGVRRLYALVVAAWLTASRTFWHRAVRVARGAARLAVAPRRFWLRRRRVLAGFRRSSPRTTPVAQKLGPVQAAPTNPMPEVEETPARETEAVVAPAMDTSVPPPSEPSVAATTPEEPAEPAEQVAPKPKRTPAPVKKKTPTRARAKTAASAKEKATRAGSAKPKAKTAKPKAKKAAPAAAVRKRTRSSTDAEAVAPAKRRSTRSATTSKTKKAIKATEQAAAQGQASPTPVAAEGTTDSQDGTQWPELAAAVEALREDLRNARTTPPKRRKRTGSATKGTGTSKGQKRPRSSTRAKTTAPAKQKAARSAKQPKAEKATRVIEEPAVPQGPASPTPAAANGAADIQDLARLRPDLAAAVEALQEDLRNARTETTKKSRRKSSAKAR